MMKSSKLALILSIFTLLLAGTIGCKKSTPDPSQQAQNEEAALLDETDDENLEGTLEADPEAAVEADADAEADAEAALAEKLRDTWLIDHDATIAQLPADQQQMASAFMKMMTLGIAFREDNILLMRVAMMEQNDEQEGNYKIVTTQSNSLVIELSREDTVDENGEIVHEEASTMVVTFLNDDKISFKPLAEGDESQAELDEEALVLRRVSQEEFDAAFASNAGPTLEELGIDPSDLEAN